jgi:hypothetical protein
MPARCNTVADYGTLACFGKICSLSSLVLHIGDRHSIRGLLCPCVQVWHRLSKQVLQPDDPFPLHRLLYQAAYQAWQPAKQVRGLVELRMLYFPQQAGRAE